MTAAPTPPPKRPGGRALGYYRRDAALRLPRCCAAHRLQAFDVVGQILAIDTFDTIGEMVAAGWRPDDAAAAASEWIAEQMRTAIGAGAAFAVAAAS